MEFTTCSVSRSNLQASQFPRIIRLVGTLACGLAAGVAAYALVDGDHFLLGALGFAPLCAVMGAVLAFRTINEQLKDDGAGK